MLKAKSTLGARAMRPKAAAWPVVRLAFVMMTLWPVAVGLGQGTSSPSAANDNFAVANPLVGDAVKVDPKLSPIIRTRLDAITPIGARSGGLRGDDTPTAGEAAQIAKNPAFAAAFARNREETLQLLRWVNATLKKAVH